MTQFVNFDKIKNGEKIMESSKEKFEELVIQAKQAEMMRDFLSSDEATEDEGLGMTDDEFFNAQEQYYDLLLTIKEGAQSVHPQLIMSHAEARLSQLETLKSDDNADHESIEFEERAINMITGYCNTQTLDITPVE